MVKDFVMKIQNPRYNESGTIDCEINHPDYGWTPFTASPNDPEQHGRDIFEAVKDIAAPYVPPPDPTPEEILAAERAGWSCTRAQGKLAIGPEIWAKVVALADDPETPWGLKVAIYDTYEWRRLDPDMDALIWAMQLTPEEADDLFRLAMTL